VKAASGIATFRTKRLAISALCPPVNLVRCLF